MAKKKGMGTATWILLLLLVLSLGGFGITQFGQSVQTVAMVGDAEVTTDDYARAVQNQINSFQRETGSALTFQQAQAFGIDRAAIGTLITEAAIENETNRIGLSTGDQNVAAELQRVPAFQGLSGTFDRQAYELTLRQSGLNSREFEDQIRGDLAEGLLRRAVGAGVTTPDIFVDTLYNHARETRDVTWARLTEADLATPLSDPTESDLAAYHEANPAAFTRPETKVIRYAWLTPDMLAPMIDLDEDQLKSLYEEQIDDFVRPERRLVERLVFATQADADAAKAQIDAGEASFDDIVARRGLDLADIDLGDVTEDELGDAGAAIFGLGEPDVVGPFPSDLGPALFRMNGILAAEEVSFEEARETLSAEAAADRARRMILELVPQIEDLLAGGADPALLAERTDMAEGRIEWNADIFDDIAAYNGFRRAAAAANPGDFAEVIELDDGGIVTLVVDEVRAPELIPLDEVRDEVAAAWTRDETQAALTAQAEALAGQLREGREMAALDLDLNVNRELSRDGFIEGTPPDFTREVFALEDGAITVLAADGDAWLVRLDAVIAADSAMPEAQALKRAFATETAQAFSNAITQAFTQALIDEAGVQINQSAINAVNTQLP